MPMPRSLVVCLVVALLALTGCLDASGSGGSGGAASPAKPGSHGVGAGEPSLRAYYRQRLDWHDCGHVQCATLRVPVDYRHPSAGSVGIAVEKAPATSGHPIGALVVNPGGPGEPGVDLAEQENDYFDPPLTAAYDVVGFDPRGTGASDPVDCLSDRQLDRYEASDPEPKTPAQIRLYVAEDRTFWRGCRARSDALVDHVSTVEAAKDIDVLRAALRQPRLDYFGFSYGTELGATYAQLFPHEVGRMVLDGAVDPRLSARESDLHQAAGFETALRSYVQHCVDGGSCFLGPTVQAGLARISGLLDSISRKPLPTGSDRRLTAGLAFYGVTLPLYSKDLWPLLDAGLQAAFKGDGSRLLMLADLYTSRKADGSYANNALEAIGVINCLDDPWSIPPSAVPKQYPSFTRASPTFGRAFAWVLASCYGDPFRATDHPHLRIDGAGAPPIVVIGTTRDPATPYQEAVALSQELKSGVLITRDGDGHTGYHEHNSCVDDAVHAYLIHGKVPQDGLRC